MAQLNIDPDRMSDQEMADLAIDLFRRLVERWKLVPALMIPGADQKPAGYLVPATGMGKSPAADSAFITEGLRRLENPPDRYLTVEEFLASLEDESSGAIPA